VPWLFEQLSLLPDLGKVVVLAFGEGTVPVPDSLKVRFAGGIGDRGKLARLFAAADVFVSASLMETYGLTIVEAMACGIPVVAFQVGGIPEAAPDGKGAILCGLRDGAALLRAVTRLRKSPELRENLGRLAHDTAHSRNAMSSFADKFVGLYRECFDIKQTMPAGTSAVLT
jgi:glycosyltransferase involved in cell wall biosynthesis